LCGERPDSSAPRWKLAAGHWSVAIGTGNVL
jgi:hypothetical protein